MTYNKVTMQWVYNLHKYKSLRLQGQMTTRAIAL